jgi:hypothetical protein
MAFIQVQIMDCPIHKGYFLDQNDVGDKGFCGACCKWYSFPEGGRFATHGKSLGFWDRLNRFFGSFEGDVRGADYKTLLKMKFLIEEEIKERN